MAIAQRTPFLCFRSCGPSFLIDLTFNVLLMIPYGAALAYGGARWWAVAIPMLTSCLIELLQLGIPGRDSTLSDLITNTSGGLVGALGFWKWNWMLQWVRRRPAAVARALSLATPIFVLALTPLARFQTPKDEVLRVEPADCGPVNTRFGPNGTWIVDIPRAHCASLGVFQDSTSFLIVGGVTRARAWARAAGLKSPGLRLTPPHGDADVSIQVSPNELVAEVGGVVERVAAVPSSTWMLVIPWAITPGSTARVLLGILWLGAAAFPLGFASGIAVRILRQKLPLAPTLGAASLVATQISAAPAAADTLIPLTGVAIGLAAGWLSQRLMQRVMEATGHRATRSAGIGGPGTAESPDAHRSNTRLPADLEPQMIDSWHGRLR